MIVSSYYMKTEILSLMTLYPYSTNPAVSSIQSPNSSPGNSKILKVSCFNNVCFRLQEKNWGFNLVWLCHQLSAHSFIPLWKHQYYFLLQVEKTQRSSDEKLISWPKFCQPGVYWSELLDCCVSVNHIVFLLQRPKTKYIPAALLKRQN